MKPDEEKKDLDELEDGNEAFDFKAPCIEYQIKKRNPISVELPGK